MFAFDIEFGRAGEFASLAEQRFDHRLRVAHGNSYARGHDERQIQKRAPPRLRTKLSLRHEIEAGDGTRGGEKERQVDH